MTPFIQMRADMSRSGTKMVVNDEREKSLVRSQAMRAFRQEQRGNSMQAVTERVESEGSYAIDLQPEDHTDTLPWPCESHLINNTHVYRTALASNFVEGYFPVATAANSELASIVDFWRTPACPAEEAGYDAITLLHFGGAIGSDRIALEGFRKFVITLQLVRHEVEDKYIHAQGTLCAALELLSCEIYKVVSSGLEGWEKHIAGINAILETTNFLDEGRELHVRFSMQLRHVALMYALVKRKAVLPLRLHNSQNSQLTGASAIDELTIIALELPALLETTDYLCNECKVEESSTDYHLTLLRLQDLKAKLKSWPSEFYPDGIQAETGRGVMNQTFPTESHSHIAALAHAFRTVISLLAHEAEYSLLTASGLSAKATRKAGEKCAEELLKCISLLTSTVDGDIGQAQAVRAPIFFALRWYQHSYNPHARQEWLELEGYFQDRFDYLDWSALLPFSFMGLVWLR